MTVITHQTNCHGKGPVSLFVIWSHKEQNLSCVDLDGIVDEYSFGSAWAAGGDTSSSVKSRVFSEFSNLLPQTFKVHRFTSARCVWKARGSHTWAGRAMSTSSLPLLKLFNIFTAGDINDKFIPFKPGSVQMNFCFSASFLRLLQQFPLLSLLFFYIS